MLVHRNEGKPRANQRDSSRSQGQKGGKKQTGKVAPEGAADGSNIQDNAHTNDGGAEESVDVAMGGSDASASQDQLGSESTGRSNTAGSNKDGDVAAPGGASDSPSDHQAVENSEAAIRDTVMENLSGAMSSLRFVPRNVRLGSRKAGLPPR